MINVRVHQEWAFILHQYGWSESSLILEIFTREFGRTVVVAKGAKRPTSSFRSVLLPLQLLKVDYGGKNEIKTLKSAKWQGQIVMPKGDLLLLGLYWNELLMAFIAREDAHPELFDLYREVLSLLCSTQAVDLHAINCAFELSLLRCLGYLPRLDWDAAIQSTIMSEHSYALFEQAGLYRVDFDHPAAIPGHTWIMLEKFIKDDSMLTYLMDVCASNVKRLDKSIKNLITAQCGNRLFKFSPACIISE